MKLAAGSFRRRHFILRSRNQTFCSHGLLFSKKYVHTESNDTHTSPVDTVKKMITTKRLTGASSLLCEKVGEIKPEELSHLMLSFSKAYYSTGHIDDMVSLLDRLDAAPINHQDLCMTDTYNTIIEGILDTRGPSDALEYWNKLCKSPKAPKPTQRTLEGLVAAALNSSPEWVAEVKKYMKDNDMKVQSPYVSFQFIRHDLLCNNFEKAFAELQTWKPVPPEILVKDFVCLVSRFAPDRLPDVFEAYKDFWINKKSFVVDVFHKMKRKGDTTGHIALFKLMKQAGIKCSIEAFEALLEVALMTKREDMIKSVIYTAKVEECKFSSNFYGLVIFYYTPINKKIAWKYFLQAAAENTPIEARTLDSLCKGEEPAVLAEHTPKIAEFAKRHRLKFDEAQINHYATTLLRNKHYEQAVMWIKMLIFNTLQSKINRSIWHSLTQQLAQEKRWDQIQEIVRSVPTHLSFLLERVLPHLVRALTEKKEWNLVTKYLDSMEHIPGDLAVDIVKVANKLNPDMAQVYKSRFVSEGIQIQE